MRVRRRPAAGAGLAAMVMSGLVGVTHTPAHAGPSGDAAGPRPGPGVVVHGTGVESPQDAERVRSFWTPARRAKAVPRSIDEPQPAAAARAADPTAAAAGVTAERRAKKKPWRQRTSKGRVWTRGGDVVSTSGVLFFILDENFYTCSASLVEARNESTVVTAAHCLHNGEGDTEDNVASFVEFVPGIPDGKGGGTFTGPPGAWIATEIAVTEQWARDGDTDYDVGMIQVQEHDGKTLQESVGAAPGIKFFDEVPDDPPAVHAFGYPTNRPFSGAELVYCAGRPQQQPARDTQALRLACTMGEGSSGGPWLQGFDRRHHGGLGRMVAVTSFGYLDDRKGVYGPYFQDEARAVYRTIQRSQAY